MTHGINKAYIDALDNYIDIWVVIPRKDYIPVLANTIRRKFDNQGNRINNEDAKPIVD